MLLKTTIFTSLLTISSVHSSEQMDSIQGLYEKLLATKFNTTVEKINDGPSARFVPGVRFVFSLIQEYGCWCFLGPEHGQGHGKPQDVYDKICKDLHQGITCAKMDIENCNPNAGQRYQILARSEPSGDVVYDCETLNAGDECAQATCYLEANFVSGFIREAFNGNSPNLNEYSHALGYDNGSCKLGSSSGELGGFSEVCCGSFQANTMKPVRFYDSLPKQCCNKNNGGFSTFNPETNDCCDGQVTALGSC